MQFAIFYLFFTLDNENCNSLWLTPPVVGPENEKRTAADLIFKCLITRVCKTLSTTRWLKVCECFIVVVVFWRGPDQSTKTKKKTTSKKEKGKKKNSLVNTKRTKGRKKKWEKRYHPVGAWIYDNLLQSAPHTTPEMDPLHSYSPSPHLEKCSSALVYKYKRLALLLLVTISSRIFLSLPALVFCCFCFLYLNTATPRARDETRRDKCSRSLK